MNMAQSRSFLKKTPPSRPPLSVKKNLPPLPCSTNYSQSFGRDIEFLSLFSWQYPILHIKLQNEASQTKFIWLGDFRIGLKNEVKFFSKQFGMCTHIPCVCLCKLGADSKFQHRFHKAEVKLVTPNDLLPWLHKITLKLLEVNKKIWPRLTCALRHQVTLNMMRYMLDAHIILASWGVCFTCLEVNGLRPLKMYLQKSASSRSRDCTYSSSFSTVNAATMFLSSSSSSVGSQNS